MTKSDMNIETKLTITVGKKVLEMTPQEARELRDHLNGLLGCVQHHYWPTYAPYTTPTMPLRSASPTYTTTATAYSSGNLALVK